MLMVAFASLFCGQRCGSGLEGFGFRAQGFQCFGTMRPEASRRLGLGFQWLSLGCTVHVERRGNP